MAPTRTTVGWPPARMASRSSRPAGSTRRATTTTWRTHPETSPGPRSVRAWAGMLTSPAQLVVGDVQAPAVAAPGELQVVQEPPVAVALDRGLTCPTPRTQRRARVSSPGDNSDDDFRADLNAAEKDPNITAVHTSRPANARTLGIPPPPLMKRPVSPSWTWTSWPPAGGKATLAAHRRTRARPGRTSSPASADTRAARHERLSTTARELDAAARHVPDPGEPEQLPLRRRQSSHRGRTSTPCRGTSSPTNRQAGRPVPPEQPPRTAPHS